MNNLFLKNRTSIQLVTTLIFIYALYNFVTSTADSIEGNQINEISNQGIVEVITVTTNFPNIKFVHPIDTRSVDDKMKRPPFNKK